MDYIEDEKVPQYEPVGWRARLAESTGRRARTIATRLPVMPEAGSVGRNWLLQFRLNGRTKGLGIRRSGEIEELVSHAIFMKVDLRRRIALKRGERKRKLALQQPSLMTHVETLQETNAFRLNNPVCTVLNCSPHPELLLRIRLA